MNDEAEPVLRWFQYNHLKDNGDLKAQEMQAISKMFYDQAHDITAKIPRSAQRTIALHKLLEAKDAAVRAHIFAVENKLK